MECMDKMVTQTGSGMRRSRRGRVCVLLVFFALAALGLWQDLVAGATIYKWRDARGHLHFSDSPPQDVGARPLDGGNSRQRDNGGRRQVPPVQQRPAQPSIRDYPALPARPDNRKEPSDTLGEDRPGVFWKIEKDGRDPSYLLGTMHSSDPRVLGTVARVEKSLLACRTFVMESVMDTEAIIKIGSSLLLTDGGNLESLLGRKWYRRLVRAAAERGIPEPFLRQMKPWVAMSILSTPAFQNGQLLDLILYQKALTAGLDVRGLESTAEQLEVFEGLSMDDQLELLKMTIEQTPQMPLMLEELTRAYLEDDLEKIGRISTRFTQASAQELIQRFMNRLNAERNRRMFRRLARILEPGGVFVAVGALHLAGPQGLVARLRQAGFNLVPIH